MKKKLIFKILVAILISFAINGCSTDDEATIDPIIERSKFIMNLPSTNGDIDWNNTQLVWSQEFNDARTFEDNWIYESNLPDPEAADQLQIYLNENVEVNNGRLKIYAKKERDGQNKGDYSSGRISSKFAFQYGRIEIRAKLPAGEKSGLWAQMALVGENGIYPESGLINIMEYFSYKPNEIFITVHSAANNSDNDNLISGNIALETAEEEFHTYGILWTNNYLKFYIDNPENIFHTLERPSNANNFNWPFDQPFYLIKGIVVGGEFAGFQGIDDSIFPAVMEVDYVRVYHVQ